jgi:hypothetical protein
MCLVWALWVENTYTRGTPFYRSVPTPGELLIAFVLYADTLLSLNQIVLLLSPCYNTLHERIKDMESAFIHGFSTVWETRSQTVGGPAQVDEAHQTCSRYKGQDTPREGLERSGKPDRGRTRWSGEQGDEMTIVGACRDVLRVVSAEEGAAYDENLGPVIQEVDDLS